MIGLERKFATVTALKNLGFTIHQCWILQHCLNFYAIDKADIEEKYLSIHALRLLVKRGHLIKVEKTTYDAAHYVIAEPTMKMIREAGL